MKHVLLICLLALLCACSSDKVADTGEGEGATINLRILTRAGDVVATDRELELTTPIRLLIYNDKNELEENKTLSITQSASGVYLVDSELSILPGKKTFCLIGNESTNLTTVLSNNTNVATLAALKEISFSTIPAAGDLLPFTCEKAYTVTWGNNMVDFPLYRAVARVDLRLWKGANQASKVIKLTSVKVLNHANNSRLMEGNALAITEADVTSTRSLAPDATIKVMPTSQTDQDKSTEVLASFYLFEYVPASGDDPTSLQITYTVDGTTESETIDLAGKVNTDDTYEYYIKRNTLTDLRLIYEENNKLTITTKVASWTTPGQSVDLDKQYFLKVSTDEITIANGSTEAIFVETDYSDGMTFTIPDGLSVTGATSGSKATTLAITRTATGNKTIEVKAGNLTKIITVK